MNQIQIPVADLKPVLQSLSKVIQKRSTLPVLAAPKLPRHEDSDKRIALVVMNKETVVIATGKGDHSVSLPINGVAYHRNHRRNRRDRDRWH